MQDDYNGWEPDWANLQLSNDSSKYLYASGHGSGSVTLPEADGVLFSKDYNDDGKKKWLGFNIKRDVMVKCYCTGNVDERFKNGVDLSSWTTSDGRLLNLEHFGNANIVSMAAQLLLILSL